MKRAVMQYVLRDGEVKAFLNSGDKYNVVYYRPFNHEVNYDYIADKKHLEETLHIPDLDPEVPMEVVIRKMVDNYSYWHKRHAQPHLDRHIEMMQESKRPLPDPAMYQEWGY